MNESVEFVKRARKTSAASLVNAVLAPRREEAKLSRREISARRSFASERLGILYSHPTWMVERWLARLGEASAIALLEANNRTPRLSCVPANPQDRDEAIRELEEAGLLFEPGQLLKTRIRGERRKRGSRQSVSVGEDFDSGRGFASGSSAARRA